jgi:hypothetical protein
MKRGFYSMIVVWIALWIPGITKSQPAKPFSLLPSSETNIIFRNTLVETAELNIITYEYFYNGGGVATGDFNNDGLIDIYLTGNLVPNKLYLNKGNLKFQDITKSAGVEGKKGWKTGVSVADVNGDGWLDIYVCYSGDLEPKQRRNQLFINKGNLTFTDKAEEMGVADEGYTTQAAFFDYDRDGDLDLFVLNHNIKTLRNFDAAFVKKMVDPGAGDRLYRNDNNHFTDVTEKAGIISNPIGYGLSVIVSDINNDGWPDMYVSNDYVEEDYLYINNHNGTFSEQLKQQLQHISNFSMGADIADINNDGWPDIYTLDMLPADNKRQKLLFAPDNYELYNNQLANGFYHQLMRNMLQVNNGNGTFSELGQISGISNTDWSWSALFADFNNDGNKDLFVTNGYGRDMINRDFIKFYANERLKFLRGEPSERMFQMLKGIKVTHLHNYIFENKDGLHFRDCSTEWGFEEENLSNGAAYADFDNDGDLDLVVNRMNAEAAFYRNTLTENGKQNHYLDIKLQMPGQNSFALGTKVNIYSGKDVVTIENYPVHGFQSSMQIPLHAGLSSSQIDSVVVRWPNGEVQTIKENIKPNQLISVTYKQSGKYFEELKKPSTFFTSSEASLPFRHKEDETNDFKIQPLMPNMLSYFGPHIAKADINKDGLDDIFICGAKGQAGSLLLQTQRGDFILSKQNAFDEDAGSEDTDALFFDADGDGDLDLYVVSGSYAFAKDDPLLQDRLYINQNGTFTKSRNAIPKETFAGSCVRAGDVDGDGDLDLFVGSRVVPGRYPETPESFLLINDGKGNFENKTSVVAPALQFAGMITDAAWIDVNKDKQPDLIVCGEWMKIKCFVNDKGQLKEDANYFSDSLSGWWNRLCLADLDKDGDLDIVAGNWGDNSQLHVSRNRPASLFYADFDNNGFIDPLLCYFIGDKSYPLASRDDITDQMTSLRQRFPTYDSYSEASINDILTTEQIKNAQKLEASFFETVWFENNNGKFVMHHLPMQASCSPVYAIACDDYTGDGQIDILLGGNIEHTSIKLGKIDANYGILLAGDGKGNFSYVTQLNSGLKVQGCVRDIMQMNVGGRKTTLFGINNSMPVLYNYGSNK